MDEKLFAPSQRKLKKARQRGAAPRSSLLISAMTTSTILIVLGLSSGVLKRRLLTAMAAAFSGQWPALLAVVKPLIVIMILAFCIPLVVGLWQTKGLLSVHHLKPKFRKRTPQITVGTLVLSALKLVTLTVGLAIFFLTIRSFSFRSFYFLALGISLAFVALGLIDWRYQIWKFYRQQRMTAREKQEELKEQSVKKKH